jgi:hypothetical protein
MPRLCERRKGIPRNGPRKCSKKRRGKVLASKTSTGCKGGGKKGKRNAKTRQEKIQKETGMKRIEDWKVWARGAASEKGNGIGRE